LAQERLDLDNLYHQVENAKEELLKPFLQEQELDEKTVQLNLINIELTTESSSSRPVRDMNDDLNEEMDEEIEEGPEMVM